MRRFLCWCGGWQLCAAVMRWSPRPARGPQVAFLFSEPSAARCVECQGCDEWSVSRLTIREWQRLGTAGRSRTFVVVECRLRSANECEVLRATCGADLFRLNLYYGEAKSGKIK